MENVLQCCVAPVVQGVNLFQEKFERTYGINNNSAYQACTSMRPCEAWMPQRTGIENERCASPGSSSNLQRFSGDESMRMAIALSLCLEHRLIRFSTFASGRAALRKRRAFDNA